MNFRLILPLILIAFISGCAATGSHVVTGTIRPAISPEAVKFYTKAPEKYEVIGLVSAQNGNYQGQKAMDTIIAEIKKQAGEIGANGIIIDSAQAKDGPPVVVGFTAFSTQIPQLSGTAILVP